MCRVSHDAGGGKKGDQEREEESLGGVITMIEEFIGLFCRKCFDKP